jgi:hypothetical protein
MATNAKGDFILEIPHTRTSTKFEEERAMKDAHLARRTAKGAREYAKGGGFLSGWAGEIADANTRQAADFKTEAKGLRSYLRYLDKDED